MARKSAWLNPRKKKLVKPHTRVTKKGETEFIDAHLHDYPTKLKGKEGKKKKSKEDKLSPKETSKDKQKVKEAKKEAACRLGV